MIMENRDERTTDRFNEAGAVGDGGEPVAAVRVRCRNRPRRELRRAGQQETIVAVSSTPVTTVATAKRSLKKSIELKAFNSNSLCV